MTCTVADLAQRLGGVAEGDAAASVQALAGLADARPGDLSFLANPRYKGLLARTRATAVVVQRDWQGQWSCAALIRVDDPDRAFVAAATLFAPPPVPHPPGIHPSAVVGAGVVLGRDVHIGPCAVIEAGASIGERTVIEALCFVGAGAVIGSDGHLYPLVAVRERCRIGDRAILHCGVVIGADGYGYNVSLDADGRIVVEKIPQIGIVEIGHDVEIGANTTIDRARFGRTQIGNSVKIDNLVQIAHNVRIGDFSGIVAQAGVAGSTQIGSGCMVWAQAGLTGHIHVGDRAQVGPRAGVSKDVPPGEFVLGEPAVSKREFVKTIALPRHVEKLKERVAALEARLAALEAAGRGT